MPDTSITSQLFFQKITLPRMSQTWCFPEMLDLRPMSLNSGLPSWTLLLCGCFFCPCCTWVPHYLRHERAVVSRECGSNEERATYWCQFNQRGKVGAYWSLLDLSCWYGLLGTMLLAQDDFRVSGKYKDDLRIVANPKELPLAEAYCNALCVGLCILPAKSYKGRLTRAALRIAGYDNETYYLRGGCKGKFHSFLGDKNVQGRKRRQWFALWTWPTHSPCECWWDRLRSHSCFLL